MGAAGHRYLADALKVNATLTCIAVEGKPNYFFAFVFISVR